MITRGKSCNHRQLLSSIAAIIIGSGTFLFFLLALLGSSSGFAKNLVRFWLWFIHKSWARIWLQALYVHTCFFCLFSALSALVCKCICISSNSRKLVRCLWLTSAIREEAPSWVVWSSLMAPWLSLLLLCFFFCTDVRALLMAELMFRSTSSLVLSQFLAGEQL